MITYSQNFEDVLLERCFRDIKTGFYIDAGAWDPVLDSVTKHFYERGWRGINIEPDLEYAERLRADRPEDITLNVAVGANPGEAKFFRFSEPRLSTLSTSQIDRLSQFQFSIEETATQVVSFVSVCEQYAAGKDIHFLKIDVEGMESEIIANADWQRFRPWVVVIEATLPYSSIPAWHEWEPTLLEAGYIFVWFDGLNRYYVRKENSELQAHFSLPPNNQDMFVPYRVKMLEQELERVNQAQQELLAIKAAPMQSELVELVQAVLKNENGSVNKSSGVEEQLRALREQFSQAPWTAELAHLKDAFTAIAPAFSYLATLLRDPDNGAGGNALAGAFGHFARRVSDTSAELQKQAALSSARMNEVISGQERILARLELQDAHLMQFRAALTNYERNVEDASRQADNVRREHVAAIEARLESQAASTRSALSEMVNAFDRHASELKTGIGSQVDRLHEELTNSLQSGRQELTDRLSFISDELTPFLQRSDESLSGIVETQIVAGNRTLLQEILSALQQQQQTASNNLDEKLSQVGTLLQETVGQGHLQRGAALSAESAADAESRRLRAVVEVQKQEYRTAMAALGERANRAIEERQALRESLDDLASKVEQYRHVVRSLEQQNSSLSNQYAAAERALEQQAERIKQLEENTVAAVRSAEIERAARLGLEAEARALRQSGSWRITAPLRAIYGLVRG